MFLTDRQRAKPVADCKKKNTVSHFTEFWRMKGGIEVLLTLNMRISQSLLTNGSTCSRHSRNTHAAGRLLLGAALFITLDFKTERGGSFILFHATGCPGSPI